jgi:hypothetical protein
VLLDAGGVRLDDSGLEVSRPDPCPGCHGSMVIHREHLKDTMKEKSLAWLPVLCNRYCVVAGDVRTGSARSALRRMSSLGSALRRVSATQSSSRPVCGRRHERWPLPCFRRAPGAAVRLPGPVCHGCCGVTTR